ncbi:MAG: hypothetical protein H0V89_07060, partial [Deltaproteobacteria bacterium]|nr:hypothetical protein [Deltaproteobacteria bacterium]
MRSFAPSVLVSLALFGCEGSSERSGLVAADVSALALLQPPVVEDQPNVVLRAQDWSDIGQITGTDDWSGVTGIVGYLGDDTTTTSTIDPSTKVAPLDTSIDVIANQTATTITNGGVAEFHLANPTVALQGSGTADAANLVATVDATGLSGIRVQYTLRDIDGSADNAIQPIALHWRIGASGDYTNVPEAFVADASEGPSLATLEIPIDVTLPAAVEGASDLRIRVLTGNASGSDEWIGVDDLRITAANPATAAEDSAVGTPVYTAVGTDPEGGGLTWA